MQACAGDTPACRARLVSDVASIAYSLGMSGAQRSPAPARFGSFTRYLVIALTAMLMGAFVAWRVSSHLGGPSEEERLADCRSRLGAAADAPVADTQNQVLQRCTGAEVDWAPEGRYDLGVHRRTRSAGVWDNSIPRPGESPVHAVWVVDAPCPAVNYRVEPGERTGAAERGKTVDAQTGRPRPHDELVSALAPTPPTSGQVALVTPPGSRLMSLECATP